MKQSDLYQNKFYITKATFVLLLDVFYPLFGCAKRKGEKKNR